MMRLVNILTIIAVLGLFVIGCENSSNPVEHQSSLISGTIETAKVTIPYGATLESATFYIYADIASGKTVDLQRITNDWGEYTVTWNNFGAAYAPEIYGSFVTDAIGWKSADIKTLVQEWMDGTYDNYGFVMIQNENMSPYSRYHSRENDNFKPYLEICYTTATGIACETTLPIADAYIWEFTPDYNGGTSSRLYTGWVSGAEKQSLVKFELDQAQPEPAELGDYVWIDENRDGIQDESEPGFPDVEVELYNCQDEFITSMLTDEYGNYLFTGLMPGDYYVKFIKPEGYEFSPMDQGGDDALDSDADADGYDVCTNLESGESDLTHDAGLYLRDMEGCTLTIGFWKNHAGFGPQEDVLSQYLPIWLGTEGGDNSLFIDADDAAMAVAILKMKTYGKPFNGITKLYAQLLGAKLNIAAGADYSAIIDELAEADAYLAENFWTDWKKKDKTAIMLMSTFDDYNNGIIGPGHCDDFGDDED